MLNVQGRRRSTAGRSLEGKAPYSLSRIGALLYSARAPLSHNEHLKKKSPVL